MHSRRSDASSVFQWSAASPESQGLSSDKLDALTARLAERKTKALLVVRNDRVVLEWYAAGHGADKRHYTASMAKAIVGGLSLAIALTDGRIALDDRAAKYVPQWKDKARKSAITIRHLGSHTSGIEDAEADQLPHDKLTGWKGDFWKRLPVPADPFTLSRDAAPVLFDPGQRMQYSNPGIAMLTYCVTAAMKGNDIRSLLQDRVMRPIGVRDEDWSVGYNSTFIVDGLSLVGSWGGGGYTARAVASVGRLMLREGDWEGRRLLGRDAIRQITADARTPGHGAMGWWSNTDGTYSRVPRDAFWGSGAGHQIVVVIPSLKLIAVRNGEMLAPAAREPALYNDPVREFLFEPLVDAMTDRRTG